MQNSEEIPARSQDSRGALESLSMTQGDRRPLSAMIPEDGNRDLVPSSSSKIVEGIIQPEVISMMIDIIQVLKTDGGHDRIDTLSGRFSIDELLSSKLCVVLPLTQQSLLTSIILHRFGDTLLRSVSQEEKGTGMTRVARRRRREDAWGWMKHARDAASAFLEIGDRIFSHVQKLEERLEDEAKADRVSLLSLPDEILSIILQNVADSTCVDSGDDVLFPAKYTESSFRLSHICRRLRFISISTQCLWNRTSDLMPTEMVKLCFSRLSSAIAEVATSTASRSESYLSTAIPFSQYWRRYEHKNATFTTDELRKLASLTSGLNIPHLSYLSISNDLAATMRGCWARSQRYLDALHYFSTWSVPSLNTLRTTNFIPKPHTIPNSHSLKKLYMDLAFVPRSRFNPMDLISFLVSLSLLEELSLRFKSLNTVGGGAYRRISSPVGLSSVRKLELEFNRCSANEIRHTFASIHFPSVASLKLCAVGLEEWQDEDEIRDVNNVIHAVNLDDQTFPKLTHFELGIGVTIEGLPDIDDGGDGPLHPIDVPFTSLRHVQHLTLVGMDCDFNDPPDMRSLPALRSLTLRDCPTLRVLRLVPMLFKGGLELSQLTVENCKWIKSDFSDDSGSETGGEDSEDAEYSIVTAEEILKCISLAP